MTEKKQTSYAESNVTTESPTLIDRTIEPNFVRTQMETVQTTILKDVPQRMSDMRNDLEVSFTKSLLDYGSNVKSNGSTSTLHQKSNRQSANYSTATSKEEQNPTQIDRDMKNNPMSSTKKYEKKFRDKIFRNRESYLTALLEVEHMKVIYHIFLVIFVFYMLYNITIEYYDKGSLTFGLTTLRMGFENIQYVLGVWLLQKTFVCSIYYGLKVWWYIRFKLERKKNLQHLWSLSCLLFYITSQMIFLYIPTKVCLKQDLRFAEATALLMETVRMLMKMHAFVRTICGRVLQGRLKNGELDEVVASDVPLPHFQKYLYYLFAPTFLYRDNYPRTSAIRWKFVGARFLEAVAIIFLHSFIFECHLKPYFEDSGKTVLTTEYFVRSLFRMILPSTIIFLSGFYILLHVWLNFTAELLRFGDRMFYRDWWTAADYAAYFRNWNVVVSEWFHEYVYKEFYLNIFKGSKMASTLAVYLISAVLHEYVMGYALQICFPVMFMVFLVGGIFCMMMISHTSKDMGNVILWFTIILENVLMITLYCMEYYASSNCPKESYQRMSDILVPHLWSCSMK